MLTIYYIIDYTIIMLINVRIKKMSKFFKINIISWLLLFQKYKRKKKDKEFKNKREESEIGACKRKKEEKKV